MTPSSILSATFPRWEFDRKSANTPQIEPIQGEFFAGEALEAPASALVRETIQNSLDARTGEAPVRVRFTLPTAAILRGFDSPWLAGLRSHMIAPQNGLRQRPNDQTAVSTLLIEDYGTCGLPGDIKQTNNTAEEYRGQRNHFFHFWRAVGSSDKDASQRGSWGLGKTVLSACSCINTFFGVSCQDSNNGLRLFGLSVLRHHHLQGDGRGLEPFSPYGRFGKRLRPDGAAMPIEDASVVADFCRTFGVERKGLPGLSLVVLVPRDDFSAQSLVAAAIVQYFFPIIEGQLVVEVVAGSEKTVIDAGHVKECAKRFERGLEPHRVTLAALEDTLELARWSVQQRGLQQDLIRLNLPRQPSKPSWGDEVFAVEGWELARQRFAAGEAVELAVPLHLAPREQPIESAEFFVSLRKSPEYQAAKVSFIRDGITISRIPQKVARGLTAFVTSKHDALAGYLRRSENPAHTDWNEDSERLRADYEKPHALALRYVKNSVKEIYDRLTRPAEGIDADLFSDIFFLEEEPASDDARPAAIPGGRGLRAAKARVPTLLARPEPVRIGKRAEGIVVAGVPENVKVKDIIEVRLAYDVRRGNPFRKWSRHDFDLGEMKRAIEWNGALRLAGDGYVLEFIVERPDFEVLIGGLDLTRDVRVEARVKTPAS